MSFKESNLATFRLGNCEVCGANNARYTCPQCELKTCSLPCVKIHKRELDCDGQRNRVKFVPLKKFTSMDLQNDYILLEEAGRTVKRVALESKELNNKKRDFLRISKLRKATKVRGIKLDFLPCKFTRHRENSTYLNWNTGQLFWKVQWVFPEVKNYTTFDSRIPDSNTLEDACSKYLSKDNNNYDNCSSEELKVYHSVNKDRIKILLKAELMEGNKFYETDLENTISYNLRGKIVLEHPIFFVIFVEHLKDYEIERTEMPRENYFGDIMAPKNIFFSSAT